MLRKDPQEPPFDSWNLMLILMACAVILLGAVAMWGFGVHGPVAPAVAGAVAGECFMLGTRWRRR